MTTKTMVIIGMAAALIGVTALLINKTSSEKTDSRSTPDSLRAKQTEESLDKKPGLSTPREAREVIPVKAEEKTPLKIENTTPAQHVAPVVKDTVILKIDLPKPFPGGTPKDLRSPNLEPPLGEKGRDPLHVPTGTLLLSKGCKVTSSDSEPITGELTYVTDGDKEHDAGTYVELGPNIQWVQIDLGKEKQLFAGCMWHFFGEALVYRDVICQISNDPDFIDGVQTAFNNDHDNSSKLGKGTDKEYIESNMGRPFAISGVKGRYVRFYSRGSTSNSMNSYTEIELYGKEL